MAKYTRGEVMEAARVFYLTRSLTKTSKQTGIPIPTIQSWNERGDEAFHQGLDLAAKAFDQKHIARMRRITDKLLDRVEATAGEAKFREAAWAAAVFNDKIRVAEEKPTSITARDTKSTLKHLEELQKLFVKKSEETNSQFQDNIRKLYPVGAEE